jgi:hypothetical protein
MAMLAHPYNSLASSYLPSNKKLTLNIFCSMSEQLGSGLGGGI